MKTTVDIPAAAMFNCRIGRVAEPSFTAAVCVTITLLVCKQKPLAGLGWQNFRGNSKRHAPVRAESRQGFLFAMAKVNSFLPVKEPNYTQVPNALLDNLDSVSDAQLRLLLLLCRQTFGWHRPSALMAFSFIQKGAGLSQQGAVNAVQQLVGSGHIGRVKSGQSFEYFLVVKPLNDVARLDDQPLHDVERLPLHDVARLPHKPLNDVATNKQIELKQTKKENTTRASAQDSPLLAEFKTKWSGAYREAFGEKFGFTQSHATAIARMLAQGFSVDELIATAQKAFELKLKSPDKFAKYNTADNLHKFLDNYNPIKNEIKLPKPNGAPKVESHQMQEDIKVPVWRTVNGESVKSYE